MPTNDDYLLEDIILMKNPQLTQKILEQTKFRCNSESVVVRKAMETGDLDNVRVLIHYGRGWKTRRAIFEREIIRKIATDDLTSVRPFVERLPSWNVVEENFAISFRGLFERGTQEAVRMLLDCKIEEHVRQKFGMELLVNLFGNAKVNVTELLKNRDFNVNTQDISGETALHSAVQNDVVKNVRFLLDNGADPNSRDCVGWTPLFVVKSSECMDLLLKHGGDIQRVDKDGCTIFELLDTTSTEMTRAGLASLAVAEASGVEVRPAVREKIRASETLRAFYKSCHREIEWMKEQRDLYSVLCESDENLAEALSSSEEVTSILERTRAGHGYVHSMLEKKLNGILDVVKSREKVAEVVVENKEVCDPYDDVAAKIISRSTFEDLVMFLLIFFLSIRILF